MSKLTSVGCVLFALFYGVILPDPAGYRQALMRFQETYADLTKGTTHDAGDMAEDIVGLS